MPLNHFESPTQLDSEFTSLPSDAPVFIRWIMNQQNQFIQQALHNKSTLALPSLPQIEEQKLLIDDDEKHDIKIPIAIVRAKVIDAIPEIDEIFFKGHLHVRYGKHQWSLLHIAVLANNLAALKMLVEAGLDTTLTDRSRKTYYNFAV